MAAIFESFNVPFEIMYEICSLLSPKDFLSLRLSSKMSLEHPIITNESLWQRIVARSWPEIHYCLIDMPDTPERPLRWKTRWNWSLSSTNHVNFFGFMETLLESPKFGEAMLAHPEQSDLFQQLCSERTNPRFAKDPQPFDTSLNLKILRKLQIYEGCVVVHFIREYSARYPDMVALAAYIIKRLCFQTLLPNKRAQVLFAEYETVAALMAAMKLFPRHELLHLDGFGSIGNLTLDDANREQFYELDGANFIMDTLPNWMENSEVMRNIFFCASNSAYQKSFVKVFQKRDIMNQSIVSLLNKFPQEKSFINQYFLLLRNLTHFDSMMGINFCNLGGGKFLLDAILRYLEDPLADGNGLLYNLCAHRASYASLVKDGLFEVFAKILPEYAKGKEKTPIVSDALVAVVNICTYGGFDEKFKVHNIFRLVFNVMNAFKQEEDVVDASLRIFGHMFRGYSHFKEEALSWGLLEAILDTINPRYRDEFVESVAWTIEKLHASPGGLPSDRLRAYFASRDNWLRVRAVVTKVPDLFVYDFVAFVR